jgi:glycosyltransferase involved in cell wall biosynthesis
MISRHIDRMLFSICIPQFNRTSFLLRSLERLRSQTSSDFEVCISDGGSTDGRSGEIVQFLRVSGMRHKYESQKERAPYDRNLRAAIGLATGRYAFLLGNDDALAGPDVLKSFASTLEQNGFPEVAIANYREIATGREYRRVLTTSLVGSGPWVAANSFRNFSFVSGVILDRSRAQEFATAKWDGSEMYQMYLGTKIIAAGGRLLGIDDFAVIKDIQIPGESVDSYARKPVVKPCPIVERRLPLNLYAQVAYDAIAEHIDTQDRHGMERSIFRQVLCFTYPPWLIEYRRIQSWRYAAGVALGMRPRNIAKGLRINWMTKLYIAVLYGIVTAGGLIFPIRLFEYLKPRLHAFAKRQ